MVNLNRCHRQSPQPSWWEPYTATASPENVWKMHQRARHSAHTKWGRQVSLGWADYQKKGRENMVREKAGAREDWRRARMVKARCLRQSKNEWSRGSDRSNVARATNQEDELNSFSKIPERGRRCAWEARQERNLVYLGENSGYPLLL